MQDSAKDSSDEESLAWVAGHMKEHLAREIGVDVPVIGILTKSVREEEVPVADYREVIEPKYLFLLQDCLVVPISLYSTPEEMRAMLKKVNGLCLPGGHTNIWNTVGSRKEESDYTKAGRKLIDLAIEINKAGDYFPVLGICLGIELMAACVGGDIGIVETCDKCANYCATLDYTKEADESRIMKALTADQRARLHSVPLSFNYHSFKIDHAKFLASPKLNDFFRVVSTSPAEDGSFSFVSTIEGREYPFYAFQHHPEWSFHDFYFPRVNVVHSAETIGIGRAIGQFVRAEALKNKHVYPDKEELKGKIIVNGKLYMDSGKGYAYLLNHA